VNFHLELSNPDYQEEVSVQAEHVRKALELDYSLPLSKLHIVVEEGEDVSLYQRPYERYIRTLNERNNMKMNVYEQPKNVIEKVYLDLENASTTKSHNVKIDILQKSLGSLVGIEESEYVSDSQLDLVDSEVHAERLRHQQENLY